jgi:hypothetical protein
VITRTLCPGHSRHLSEGLHRTLGQDTGGSLEPLSVPMSGPRPFEQTPTGDTRMPANMDSDSDRGRDWRDRKFPRRGDGQNPPNIPD